MIDLTEAKRRQSALHKEAHALLTELNLARYLERLGEVKLVGSYSTGLMVSRDIDFKIYSPSTKANDVIAVATELLADIDQVAGFKITDFTKGFENTSGQTGIYFGLTIVAKSGLWKIDAPVRYPEQQQPNEERINTWLSSATESQLNELLLLKANLAEAGLYGKAGTKSQNVYAAFFEGNVRSVEEFQARR